MSGALASGRGFRPGPVIAIAAALAWLGLVIGLPLALVFAQALSRSEEHTSELQSP